MSLEAFSAENRNQMPIPLSRRRVQCCSLCRQQGHNITTCNSDRLREFELICASAVINFDNTDDFKNWLLRNYMNDQLLLKAFAIRKFRIFARCNLEQYIQCITEYIFRTYKNTQQTENDILINNNIFINELAIFLTALGTRSQHIETETSAINPVYGFNEYISYLSQIGVSLTRSEEPIPPREITLIRRETIEEENFNERCQCSICWDDKELRQFVKLNCNHEFCKDCIAHTLRPETRTNLCCALCRSEITTIAILTQEVHDELMADINS
jgi:hypothetical protein